MKASHNHDTRSAIGATRAVLLLLALGTWTTFGSAQTPLSSSIVYLSDLTPVGTPINGYGPFEKDKSNGENAADDGTSLQVGKVTYVKGLGVHPASDLTFALNKQYAKFSAIVGIDDELLTNGCAPNLPGSVVFQVFVDDVKMYDSGALTLSSPAQAVSVDVTEKSTLHLVVGGAGDDLLCDHADWADARLTLAGSAVNAGASQTFSASSGFSAIQGQNGWSYLDSTGAQLTYRPASDAGSDALWQGSEEYLRIFRDGGHPGDTRDPVRRWTAPQAGTIRITGNAHDGDPACGRGVAVLIRKGAVILWQQALRNGDTGGINFEVTTAVNQNDMIDFMINQGADGNTLCDTTFFDPTIVLTR